MGKALIIPYHVMESHSSLHEKGTSQCSVGERIVCSSQCHLCGPDITGKPVSSFSSAPSQVTEEEPSSNHTVMIQETVQQASVELAEQHHLVVSSDDVEGIETVTVYTQGGEASEFIVYVQEAVPPMEEQVGEQPAPEL